MAEILQIEQGTEEWLEARLGLATASRFKDVLDTIKSGESAKRRNYRAELLVERLTGKPLERYTNAFMEFGSDTEDLARFEYTLATGNDVKEVGFMKHDTLAAGASPDGLIGKDGGLEIKVRQLANHILSLKTGEVPSEYIAQIQGNLWISKRKWWDYVSYGPELPKNAQLFIKRVPRDKEYIAKLGSELELFLSEVDADIDFVSKYKGDAK